MPNGEKFTHESFGILNFGRASGSERVLFGSSITHSNTIIMELNHAEVERSLSRDWYFGRNKIVEIEMSPTQFADAITGLNCGNGVPVTIRYVAGQKKQVLEDPPFFKKAEQFIDESVKFSESIAKDIQEIADAAKSTATPKKIIFMLENLARVLPSNTTFIHDSFKKQMAETIKEAKGEVDAFVTSRLTSAGMEAMKDQMPQLPAAPIDI